MVVVVAAVVVIVITVGVAVVVSLLFTVHTHKSTTNPKNLRHTKGQGATVQKCHPQ